MRWALAVALVLLGLLAALLWTTTSGRLPAGVRGELETLVAEDLGLEVRIHGRLYLALSPLRVVAEGVEIRLAQPTGVPIRARFERLESRIGLGRAWRQGELAILGWSARGLRAEVGGSLPELWSALVREEPPARAQQVGARAARRGIRLSAIPELRFEDAQLRYRSLGGGWRTLSMRRGSLRGLQPMQVELELQWDEVSIVLRGALRQANAADLVVDLAEGRLASSQLTGRLVLDPTAMPPRVAVELRSSRLDLGEIFRLWQGSGRTGRVAGDATQPPAVSSPEAFPEWLDRPVDLAWLRNLDGALTFAVDELDAPGLRIDDLNGELGLQGGVLEGRIQGASLYGGSLRGRLVASARARTPALELAGEANGLALAQIFGRQVPDFQGHLDLRFDLGGSGASLRALLASASGNLRVASSDLRSSDPNVQRLGRNALGLLLSIVGSPQGVQLNCAVTDVELEGGQGRVYALADTPSLTLRGEGGVDLASLRVDVFLKPHPKRAGVAKLKLPLRISGPLLDPLVHVDTEAMARETVTILGRTVLNPALIVVPFVNLGTEGNPCVVALENGVKAATPEKDLMLRAAETLAPLYWGKKLLQLR